MKDTTWSLRALVSHTPAWASKALAGLATIYGAHQACLVQGLFVLSPDVEHKINGAYGVLTLLLLGFGGRKKPDVTDGSM